MSEQPTTQEPEALVLGSDPGANMSAIMDFLAPEPDEAPAAEGGEAGAPAAAEPGQQPAGAEGAPAAAGDAGAPADGDGGVAPVPTDGGAAAGAVVEPGPGVGSVDADSLKDKWGEVSNSFETKQMEYLEKDALAGVREEFKEYFDHVQQHPRLLVGKEVNSLTGQGKEKLRDANDAREWQEAAKHLLAEEVKARAATKADELRDVFDTVHSSIDLFRNNVDLIPGTKQFDKELADKFVDLAKDYELRSNDKLIGYSVPVQPMINQLRSQLASSRAAAAATASAAAPAAAAPAASARAQQAAAQPRTATGQFDAPQGGVTSKAGQSGEGQSEGEGVLNAFFRQNGAGGFSF